MILNHKKIVENWISAFNDHNIVKLLDLYHKDAVHYSPRLEEEKPETNGWLRGKEQLKWWWQRSFNELPTLNYELKDITANGLKVFIEYVRKVSFEEDKYVMEYFKIDNLGLIVESRVLRSWIVNKNN